MAAIVGHATQDSARIWLRSGCPGEFAMLLYRWDAAIESAGGEAALRLALKSVPLPPDGAAAVLRGMRREDVDVDDYATDTTHVVDLARLDADTRYGYALYARDRERALLGHNRLRRFRTPPPESERRSFQFALFSCHMPYAVHGLFGRHAGESVAKRFSAVGGVSDAGMVGRYSTVQGRAAEGKGRIPGVVRRGEYPRRPPESASFGRTATLRVIGRRNGNGGGIDQPNRSPASVNVQR